MIYTDPHVILESRYEQRLVRVGAEAEHRHDLVDYMYQHGSPNVLNDTRLERLKSGIASFGLSVAMGQNRYDGKPITTETPPEPERSSLCVPHVFLPDILVSIVAVTNFSPFRAYMHSVRRQDAATTLRNYWDLVGHGDN